MYTVSPTNTELLHLRVLLLRVKGATSFEDLRTVNGNVEPTFTAACIALGLIENDQEWYHAMEESSHSMMPKELRNLFARILIHCNVLNPKDLWDKFKNFLSEDYQILNIEERYIRAYNDVNNILMQENKQITDYIELDSMILLTDNSNNAIHIRNFDATLLLEVGNTKYALLNDEQRNIVDTVLNLASKLNDHTISDDSNNCIFISGIGGSGKTFVYDTLWHLLNGNNQKVCSMAFTGIAATLLQWGKTIHKVFKLPVPLEPHSTANITLESNEAEYLKNTDVIIVDEAFAAPKYSFEAMDKCLQDIMNNNKLFGGKIIILGGDPRQLLPVLKNATPSEKIHLSIKFSYLYGNFQQFTLKKNMRHYLKKKTLLTFYLL